MKKFFIPFVPGVFKLLCKGCGGQCCWEGGVLTREEYALLSKQFPSLKYFVITDEKYRAKDRHPLAMHALGNCWLLDQNGMCSLHRKQKNGRSIKPILCRTFPYMVEKCHDTYIVTIGGCFKSSVIARPPSSFKSKAKAREMLGQIRCFLSYKCAWHKDGVVSWSKKRLEIEKKTFEESKHFFNREDYTDFVMRQLQIAFGETDLSRIEPLVSQKLRFYKKFLDIGHISLRNKKISYEMTVLTSLLRLYMDKVNEKIAPLVLLATYILMILHRSAANKTGNPVTIASYRSALSRGVGFIALGDNRACKAKLLAFAGIKKRRELLRSGYSIIDLAEKLKLRTEDRMSFVYNLNRSHASWRLVR